MGKKYSTKRATVIERVLEICTVFPEYIGDGNRIIMEYWMNYDPSYSTPAETILRAYRRLCERGEIVLNQSQQQKRERYQKPSSVARIFR